MSTRIFHQMKRYAILRNVSIEVAAAKQPEYLRPDASVSRATERGLKLVSILGDHPVGVSLADAARAAELTPSTALRQLRSLAMSGFSVQRDDGNWFPGPELLRLSRVLFDYATLASLAQPVLVCLARQTGESAYLAEAVDAATATYVAIEESRHAVRHVSWLGRTLDTRRTAVGAALRNRVDKDGAVLRHDAVEDGVTAISAPVRPAGRIVLAAVSVVGPTYRLERFGFEQARLAVVAAAREISSLVEVRSTAAAF